MELKHFRLLYKIIALYTILRFQFVVSVIKKKNSVHTMRANNEGLLTYFRVYGQERLVRWRVVPVGVENPGKGNIIQTITCLRH